MNCLRCGKILQGKQQKYCSLYCNELAAKARYRKKHKDQINAYKRAYNKLGIRGNPGTNHILERFLTKYPSCEKCGSKEDLQLAHIKPRWRGGRNIDNLITLCRKHHYEFDNCLRKFWKIENATSLQAA